MDKRAIDPSTLDAVAKKRAAALEAADARGGFLSGVAASLALFGFAGVAGYLVLPAMATDVAPVAPTSVEFSQTVEAAPVSVSYAAPAHVGQDMSLDGLYSARFGDDLRVTFSAAVSVIPTATAAGAKVAVPAPVAAPVQVRVESVDAGTPTIAVATVDTVELTFGQPIDTADLKGVMPAFITDMPSEEPSER